jgi:hypothetical protein
MYELKNYMLSMQSHWMIHQPTYQAVQDSIPMITKYRANKGIEKLGNTPAKKICKKRFPEIYTFPLFRRQWCKMMVEEIEEMRKELAFEANQDEDELRQIPEIVLKEQCPELYRNMWFVVRTIISPMIMSIWQRDCEDPASIQIANYNIVDKQQGAWHHDESADISVVVPLNTGGYKGGGTEFHNHGTLKPLPNGHALMFPSFTNLHRGLAVDGGDRYLLVFWLYDKSRVVHLYEDLP